jgi:sporulation related protein
VAADIDRRRAERVADVPVRPNTGTAPAAAPVAAVRATDADSTGHDAPVAKQFDQGNVPAPEVGVAAVPVKGSAGEAAAVEHPITAGTAEREAPAAAVRGGDVRPPAQVAKAVLRVDDPTDEGSGGRSGQRVEPAPPQGARSPRLDGVEFTEIAVRGGDSMSGIALRKYGQATYTILDLLKLANPQLKDIDVIAAGQTIRLPELGEGFPVLDDGSGHYALLVYSTPNAARASALQNALRSRGFDAQVSAGRIGADKAISRVVVAGFTDRGAVAGVGKELQRLFRDDLKIAQLGE